MASILCRTSPDTRPAQRFSACCSARQLNNIIRISLRKVKHRKARMVVETWNRHVHDGRCYAQRSASRRPRRRAVSCLLGCFYNAKDVTQWCANCLGSEMRMPRVIWSLISWGPMLD